MASGDTLLVFTSDDCRSPASNGATHDVRNDHPVIDFDAATQETTYLEAVLPRGYAGGGLTVTLYWMATSATSGAVVWSVALERHEDDAFDLDANGFASAKTVTSTAPSASGEVGVDSVAFTDGAEIDGLLAGESFRLSVARAVADVGDDMVGDAELFKVEVRET